jgi:hypothetical protein
VHARRAFVLVVHVLQQAVIGLDAAIAQMRGRCGRGGETHELLGSPCARAPLRDIELGENAQLFAWGPCGLREGCDVVEAVDDGGEAFGLEVERGETIDHRCAGDGGSEKDIVEPTAHQDFGFTERRAACADGACLALQARDGEGFGGLEMRPERQAQTGGHIGEERDIVLKRIEVQQERRVVQA